MQEKEQEQDRAPLLSPLEQGTKNPRWQDDRMSKFQDENDEMTILTFVIYINWEIVQPSSTNGHLKHTDKLNTSIYFGWAW